MASDGPSPHSPSLRLGLRLPAPQPSRRHHAQSLLGPSFHDPRTHHVLESHPERAAPLSSRNDERCHAIVSHSALALRLYLAAYNTSSNCRVGVLDHLCSNLSQSFHPIPLPCALAFQGFHTSTERSKRFTLSRCLLSADGSLSPCQSTSSKYCCISCCCFCVSPCTTKINT